MRRVRLIIFGLFSVLSLHAQTDFRPGYFVTHQGDTVDGLLDFREGSQKYAVCYFKTSREATVKQLTAGDIRGYRFQNDKFFLSKTIKSYANTFTRVFVEVIVRGKVSLFRHENDFYVSKDSVLHKLVNEQHPGIVNGKRVMLESNRHIGVLNYLMSDCKAVQFQLRRAKLFERNLTELVEQYNQCGDGQAVTYKSHLSYVDATFGLAAGAMAAEIRFPHNSGYTEALGQFERSFSPAVGLFMDLSSPRVDQRFGFHAGIFYSQARYHAFNAVDKAYYTDRHYVSMETETVQIPFGVRYSLPERTYTPYFSAGLVTAYNLSGKTHWVRETQVDNTVETYESDEIQLNRSQAGLWGGVGIRRKFLPTTDLFVEFRYIKTPESIHAMESLSNVGPSISAFQIFLGIRTR